MKKISSLVQFESMGFDLLCEMQTDESWKSLTDKFAVKLPRFHFKQNNKPLDELLVRKQKVRVSLGYDDNLAVVFNGYISAIKPTTPVEVICEDAMMLLKDEPVKMKSWTDASLQDILSHLGINDAVISETINPGAFMIDEKHGSVSKVMQKLKDDLGIYIFYRKGKLHAGRFDTIYNKLTANTVPFVFGKNIIAHELAYKTAAETKLKIVAGVVTKAGKKLQQEKGEDGGEILKIKCDNRLTEADLKAIAESEYKRRCFDGFRGKFIAFGEPYVTHGDIVELTDEVDNDKSGSYWVDSVVRKCGTNGYRQEISLGPRADK